MTLEAFLRKHGAVQLTARLVTDADGRERVTFLAEPKTGAYALIGEVRDNGLQGIDLVNRPAPGKQDGPSASAGT